MELQNIHRLAVFKMRNIGDVLVMTPLLRALRETFPAARITVVVNSGTEAMLAHNPHIDEVLVYQRHGRKAGPLGRLRYELGFVRELRRRKFDLTMGLTEGDRTAWYSLLGGARWRLGMCHGSWGKHDPRRQAYNLLAPPSLTPMHEVEKHFWIVEHAGLKLRSTVPGDLCLVVPDDLRAWARREVKPLRPARIIHVHPVSRWLWKCWSNEAMAAVIDWLEFERNVRVVVTTGPVPAERTRAQEIIRLCRSRPWFYDGTISLSQTAALSAEADAYFGVDTAPMHMAAAVGTPVIALFGPSFPENWGPWTSRKQILTHPCLCHQTRIQTCAPDQVRACLAAITVAEAQAALDQLLATSKLELSPQA
jgi:heptosyltransferase-3